MISITSTLESSSTSSLHDGLMLTEKLCASAGQKLTSLSALANFCQKLPMTVLI
jgi:hypothetical protein